jgi:hypothetical protein
MRTSTNWWCQSDADTLFSLVRVFFRLFRREISWCQFKFPRKRTPLEGLRKLIDSFIRACLRSRVVQVHVLHCGF